MNEADVINLIREAIYVTLKLSAPMLLIGMLVGLVIAIFQTTTSIQEQTLTFVPKLVAILLAIIFFAGWMNQTLIDYTINIFSMIPKM